MSDKPKTYTVKSMTDSSKQYKVTYFEESDRWVCTCPSYIFHEEGFECKHIKAVKRSLVKQES
jgi:predicted nucleic acid-binding Zn finger protein